MSALSCSLQALFYFSWGFYGEGKCVMNFSFSFFSRFIASFTYLKLNFGAGLPLEIGTRYSHHSPGGTYISNLRTMGDLCSTEGACCSDQIVQEHPLGRSKLFTWTWG